MNNKLNWQDNTKELVKKASKRLYIIRVLQRCGLSSNDLLLVYFSMVRSILEYACPVWHTITRMPSTSLSANVLTTDVKSYVLKLSKGS